MRSLATLDDIFDAALDSSNNGTALLRAGLAQLRAGRLREASIMLGRCRSYGIPAELAPHADALYTLTLLTLGSHAEATEVVEVSWNAYPDFAVLPVLLGACYRAAGRAHDAATVLYAAALADDPDRSLERYRPLLNAELYRHKRHAA